MDAVSEDEAPDETLDPRELISPEPLVTVIINKRTKCLHYPVEHEADSNQHIVVEDDEYLHSNWGTICNKQMVATEFWLAHDWATDEEVQRNRVFLCTGCLPLPQCPPCPMLCSYMVETGLCGGFCDDNHHEDGDHRCPLHATECSVDASVIPVGPSGNVCLDGMTDPRTAS